MCLLDGTSSGKFEHKGYRVYYSGSTVAHSITQKTLSGLKVLRLMLTLVSFKVSPTRPIHPLEKLGEGSN